MNRNDGDFMFDIYFVNLNLFIYILLATRAAYTLYPHSGLLPRMGELPTYLITPI